MRILVTGGAGFIGANLVHYLLGPAEVECGMAVERVVTLDKLTYAGNLLNLKAVEADERHVFECGDIGDCERVARLLREHRIQAVMHLAAESHVDRSIDEAGGFIETNVAGTCRLLEVFRDYLAELGNEVDGKKAVFLHVSTDEVFGSLGPEDAPFTEDSPYAPNNPYSASKAGGDHLARAFFQTYGLPVVTTHCSNNYGPYQFPEKLIPLMIGKLRRGEPLPVYGDGRQVRDWLHVTDHCRGMVAALLRGAAGRSYLIGGGREVRNIDLVRELMDIFCELAPGAAVPRVEHVTDRPGHDRRYAVDASRIRAELGWEPREDFASGLRGTVRWYLENEAWVRAIESGRYRGERLGTRGRESIVEE